MQGADEDQDTGLFWPEQFLPKVVPNARILTYGYDADLIRGMFQASSKNSILKHGNDMMMKLERSVRNEVCVFNSVSVSLLT